VACLRSSEGVLPWVRRGALAACLLGFAACATVRPEDKEFLADPAMTYGGGEEVGQQSHVLANREGALPGTATSGGGCGCN
jgi:Domain of unknown function (DUF4266)